jgi:Ni/Co efflux regulator RcnB
VAPMHRILIAVVASFSLAAVPLALAQGKSDKEKGGPDQVQQDKAKGKAEKSGHDKVKPVRGHHHNGKDMVGDKIKTNGRHVIEKKGDYTAAVDIQGGKVAGMKVTHATKGDVPVTKYKTTKKMARADGFQTAAFVHVQAIDLGTTYIGYAYVDDLGNEEIYWYPYDMILDGDTGAVNYVPVY